MNEIIQSLDSMIGWMSKINHVECDDCEMMFTPLQIMNESMNITINPSSNQSANQSINPLDSTERLREDRVDTKNRVDIVQLAPHSDRGFLVVPKVVDIDE